ncbi:hypothetical protein P3S68_014439 [Capsicum galapagoense]
MASATNKVAPTVSEKPRVRHQHSQSVDGSTTIKPEILMSVVWKSHLQLKLRKQHPMLSLLNLLLLIQLFGLIDKEIH